MFFPLIFCSGLGLTAIKIFVRNIHARKKTWKCKINKNAKRNTKTIQNINAEKTSRIQKKKKNPQTLFCAVALCGNRCTNNFYFCSIFCKQPMSHQLQRRVIRHSSVVISLKQNQHSH